MGNIRFFEVAGGDWNNRLKFPTRDPRNLFARVFRPRPDRGTGRKWYKNHQSVMLTEETPEERNQSNLGQLIIQTKEVASTQNNDEREQAYLDRIANTFAPEF